MPIDQNGPTERETAPAVARERRSETSNLNIRHATDDASIVAASRPPLPQASHADLGLVDTSPAGGNA
jgi:hypothetical protein